MSTKVHPVLVDPLTQLVDALAAVQPNDYAALQTRILANAAALRTLEGAGFVRQDSREPDHDAKLPPELEGFTTLKDSPAVAAALSNASFKDAQKAVENAPDNPEALAALRTEVKTVRAAYKEAIAARVKEDGIRQTCRKVIVAGNKDFQGVYGQVWQRIPRNDEEGIAAYEEAIKRVTAPENAPRQTTKDPCQLYQHAAKIKGDYAAFVTSLVEGMSLKVSIPQHLKSMSRIIEKSLLKRKDDPGNANRVGDIVRGMLTCRGMQQIAVVLGRMAERQDIVITRIKDRFIACPSAGGWRDCMINFYLKADANKHICEIQLVHSQMLMARHGLPGHDVYNCVRNADELVNQWMDGEQPQSKEEILKWLKEWQAGDLLTHGPPGLWDVSKLDADAASSILSKACSRGEVGLVKLLLALPGTNVSHPGTNVSPGDKYGSTPLFLASQRGHTEVVKLLLANGADVNHGDEDEDGDTPLFIASTNGNTEVVKVLLANGADGHKADKEGNTPLFIASTNGKTEVVKLLLANGADVNKADSNGNTPLLNASTRGRTEVVKVLLAKGADVNKADSNGQTPLLKASENGRQPEVVKSLLAKGADVNKADSNGQTPLWVASSNGRQPEIVKSLLANGADVNKADSNGQTPLWKASSNGYTEVVKSLLANGADVNKADSNGQTPLYWASYNGHTESVKLLLAAGADVNKATNNGYTPLLWASQRGHTEVVKLLLAKDADVNQANKIGRTPLYWASQEGHTEIVKLLLANGADLNQANSHGTTPLYWASYNGHTEVVKLLLANGADVNKADEDGSTPLWNASYKGHTEIIKLLLANGADVNKADESGRTPLWKASQYGHTEVVELLKAAGAK